MKKLSLKKFIDLKNEKIKSKKYKIKTKRDKNDISR